MPDRPIQEQIAVASGFWQVFWIKFRFPQNLAELLHLTLNTSQDNSVRLLRLKQDTSGIHHLNILVNHIANRFSIIKVSKFPTITVNDTAEREAGPATRHETA